MIDLDKIKKAFDGDEEILLAVSSEFKTQLPKDLEEFQTLVEVKDIEGLRIKAHTLKGLAGTFFCEAAKEVAEKVETAAKSDNIDEINSLKGSFLIEFNILLDDVSKVLEADCE